MAGSPVNAIDILLVEDNPGDVELTKEALGESAADTEVDAVSRGQAALDHLQDRGDRPSTSLPDLVLLDLSLPDVGGFHVLYAIRDDPELRTVPVIILTGSTDEEDVTEGYEKQANAYLTKPDDSDQFRDFGPRLVEFWAEFVQLPSGFE